MSYVACSLFVFFFFDINQHLKKTGWICSVLKKKNFEFIIDNIVVSFNMFRLSQQTILTG